MPTRVSLEKPSAGKQSTKTRKRSFARRGTGSKNTRGDMKGKGDGRGTFAVRHPRRKAHECCTQYGIGDRDPLRDRELRDVRPASLGYGVHLRAHRHPGRDLRILPVVV